MTAPPSEISSVPAPAPLAGPHGVRPGARRRETPEAVRPGDHDRPEPAAPDVCVRARRWMDQRVKRSVSPSVPPRLRGACPCF
jgi:hypothetical protein